MIKYLQINLSTVSNDQKFNSKQSWSRPPKSGYFVAPYATSNLNDLTLGDDVMEFLRVQMIMSNHTADWNSSKSNERAP